MIPKFTTVKGSTVAKFLQTNGRATASTLVKLTGRPIKSVLSTLKTLHDRSKIHIAAYETNKRGHATSRVWAWGDGDDAREPVMIGKQTFIPRPDAAAAWLRNPI